ncbi:hypothetical protein MD484_g8867, partial [Candolleomyces efflorescens]
MPKSPKSFSSFPRRQFAMQAAFDRDLEGPHEITFPVYAPTPPIRLDAFAEQDDDGLESDQAGVSGMAQAGENGDVHELDDDAPFERLRDKRFYGKQVSFYYYYYSTPRDLDRPPVHPPTTTISLDTLFVHRNPVTARTQSWRWGKSDSGEGWIKLQEKEKHQYDHGSYHYTVTATGMPSWINPETLRKTKYKAPVRATRGSASSSAGSGMDATSASGVGRAS